jgi:probable HAF family extracellular repeat protein
MSYLPGNLTYHATMWNGTASIDLGSLGATGNRGSLANAINDSGQVVGYSFNDGEYAHATLWNGTSIIDLAPSGRASMANGINDRGEIVGFTQDRFEVKYHAALWNSGSWTDLSSTLHYEYSSYAYAINESGQVVGTSGGINQSTYGAMWFGGGVTALPGLGGAVAVNNSGHVAGLVLAGGVVHAAVWDGVTTADLGAVGGVLATSYATDINNLGQVVGWSDIDGYHHRATLWDGAGAIDLNSFLTPEEISAGWVLREANGINDSGWIVGNALNSITTETHAFLMKSTTSVPEPKSYALLLLALGLLGLSSRRSIFPS